MTSISQKLALAALGTALSFAALEINPAQADAQAYKYNFSTYYLTTTTNNTGSFSIAHGLSSSYAIWGMKVAVQHVNGNWHTLEFSNSVDNRFWWNSQRVEGVMASPNFRNRPVRIILTVAP